jgi:hypothetical protein
MQVCPEPQATQATPPVPHAASLSAPTAMHVAPLQQPAQLPGPHAGLQAPPWQVLVPVHATHAEPAPAEPQAPFVSLPRVTQVLPLQHPVQFAGPHVGWQEPL